MAADALKVIRSVRGLLSEAAAVESQNKDEGFYGCIMQAHPKVVNLSRDAASKLFGAFTSYIASKFGLKPEQARDFLDGRDGRHLGDLISRSGITDVKSLPDAIQMQLSTRVQRFKVSSELRGPRAGLTGDLRGAMPPSRRDRLAGFSDRSREPDRSQNAFRHDPQSGVRESVETFESWFENNKDSEELRDDYKAYVHDLERSAPAEVADFEAFCKERWGESLGESNMSYCVFENTARDMSDAVEKLRDITNGNEYVGGMSEYELKGLHSLAEHAKAFIELYGEGDFPHEPEASAEDEEHEDLVHQ